MKNKQKTIFGELKKAKKESDIASVKEKELMQAMQAEIKKVVERFTPSLNEVQKNCLDKILYMYDIGESLFEYASFYVRDICEIVAKLMSYIELEPFVTTDNDEANINGIIIRKATLDRLGEKTFRDLDFVAIEKLYHENELAFLQDVLSSQVRLYSKIGEPLYQLGNFNYVKEFINRLIIYRIENKMKAITIDELYKFMYRFLLTHRHLIEESKARKMTKLATEEEREQLLSKYSLLKKN